ncbi:unnamed protein product [Scytosiphon promiscuus]
MPPAFPRPALHEQLALFVARLSRRRGLCLLWATPVFLLACLWAWRTTVSSPVAAEHPGVLGLRTRNGVGVADDVGGPALADWYPVPDRIPPVARPAELGDFLTGEDFMDILEDARIRTKNGTIGFNESEPRATMKAAPAANLLTAAAVGDDPGSVRPMPTAFSPGWKSAPTDRNRCSALDMSAVAERMACGPPLAEPCFDRGRCRPPSAGGPGPSIYVFDATCSVANSSALPPSTESLMLSHTWREAARAAGVLAESYSEACMFLHVNKRVGSVPCPAERPLWNGGRNHVMVDFTDYARNKRSTVAGSMAMDAASNIRSCIYRSGFDFAVPLRHQQGFSNLTHVAPWHREYFLTMKGTLYLSGSGYEERMEVLALHSEPDGVVMALNCFDLHDEHLLPQYEEFCVALNDTSSRHEYEDLMNTTFGLVAAGRSPATYRLAEVMSAGAIPVFVARDIVKPFPERVDWPSLSFSFPPEEVGPAMLATLRAVAPAELLAMQRKSVEAFLDVFGEEPGYDRIARVVVDELVSRVGYHR